jgi:hypothetical protein
MAIFTIDDFRTNYLGPAQAELASVQAAIDVAVAAYKALSATQSYDDGATITAQAAVATLKLQLERWQQRTSYLQACANAYATNGGKVIAF